MNKKHSKQLIKILLADIQNKYAVKNARQAILGTKYLEAYHTNNIVKTDALSDSVQLNNKQLDSCG
ncbi:MAG: hypothetical protein WKG06_08275 [Segetibacter sp.]